MLCVPPQIINLPIVAAFAGLTVGCVPFLKGLLFGPEAPLGFIRDCLEVETRLRSGSRTLAHLPVSLCTCNLQGRACRLTINADVASISAAQLLHCCGFSVRAVLLMFAFPV